MKKRQMLEIDNVANANEILDKLRGRTVSETVGLGLFYGRPGLGKSRWAFNTAVKNGYVYYRLINNITVRDFLMDLLVKLHYQLASAYQVRGTSKQIYDEILEILQSKPDMVIFIDEIDYAFKFKRLLATIRDLADQTFCTFVLIGMQSAKNELLKFNNHYFDRCNGFYEFSPLSEKDISKLLSNVCDVSVDNETVKYVTEKSSGNMRIVMKYIDVIERIGKKCKTKSLEFADVKELFDETNN